MKWQEIREQYPGAWLLAEALDAYTTQDNRRIVGQWAVIDSFSSFYEAMRRYKKIHRQAPARELYVVHTDNPEVKITEQRWVGIRGNA